MNISKTLTEIIRIPSLSGHERNLADYIFTELIVLGFKPTKLDGNIILRVAGTNKSKALIFNAHMDTVSSGPMSLWKYPPYGKEAGIEHDGKIYGLGASDAKGSIAALLGLAKHFSKNTPAIDIWLVFVAKEETGGDGTKAFLSWFIEKGWPGKYADLSAIVCKPTAMKEVQIGHRGNIHIEITLTGDGGHGSEPQLVSRHAILETVGIIEALKKLEKKWQREYADTVLEKPTIGITSIQAGDPMAPNKFPDTCSITIDVRTTVRLHAKAFGLIAALAKKYKGEVRPVYMPSPPGHTDPKAPIVEKAKKLVGKTGLAADSTDLCFFSELGIPGIILGPGEHAISHKPNEYCEVKQVEKAINDFLKLILSF